MVLRELIARASGDGIGSYVGPDRDLDEVWAHAILTALDAAGLVVVPREPTEEMLWAVRSYIDRDAYIDGETYQAMIAASPFAKKEVG